MWWTVYNQRETALAAGFLTCIAFFITLDGYAFGRRIDGFMDMGMTFFIPATLATLGLLCMSSVTIDDLTGTHRRISSNQKEDQLSDHDFYSDDEEDNGEDVNPFASPDDHRKFDRKDCRRILTMSVFLTSFSLFFIAVAIGITVYQKHSRWIGYWPGIACFANPCILFFASLALLLSRSNLHSIGKSVMTEDPSGEDVSDDRHTTTYV